MFRIMGRRKDHSREELLEMSITAGKQLVSEGGASALTARNVASKIGYTAGTLYNVFENLQGLATAINTAVLMDFGNTVDSIVKTKSTASDCVSAICQAYLDFQSKEPKLWALAFASGQVGEGIDYSNAVHRIFDPLADALFAISGDTELARKDAKVVWCTLHGICLLRQNGKLAVTKDDTSEVLVERFLQQFLKAK